MTSRQKERVQKYYTYIQLRFTVVVWLYFFRLFGHVIFRLPKWQIDYAFEKNTVFEQKAEKTGFSKSILKVE